MTHRLRQERNVHVFPGQREEEREEGFLRQDQVLKLGTRETDSTLRENELEQCHDDWKTENFEQWHKREITDVQLVGRGAAKDERVVRIQSTEDDIEQPTRRCRRLSHEIRDHEFDRVLPVPGESRRVQMLQEVLELCEEGVMRHENQGPRQEGRKLGVRWRRRKSRTGLRNAGRLRGSGALSKCGCPLVGGGARTVALRGIRGFFCRWNIDRRTAGRSTSLLSIPLLPERHCEM